MFYTFHFDIFMYSMAFSRSVKQMVVVAGCTKDFFISLISYCFFQSLSLLEDFPFLDNKQFLKLNPSLFNFLKFFTPINSIFFFLIFLLSLYFLFFVFKLISYFLPVFMKMIDSVKICKRLY